jgi:hypothetical protein
MEAAMKMKGLGICAFVLIAVAAWPAFGQENVVTGGEASYQDFKYLPPTVKDAPYSGEVVREHSRSQPDGDRVTQATTTDRMFRDSQGRVRTEQWHASRRYPIFVISDPVAMYIYVVDTVDRVVHRVPAEARRPRRAVTAAPGVGAATVAQSKQANAVQVTEDLCSKTIEGLEVTGTRIATTTPDGRQKSNRETWTSAKLHLDVLRVDYDSAGGTRTTKIANLSTGEPDPSLFTISADYAIVEETGTFTIRWGGR